MKIENKKKGESTMDEKEKYYAEIETRLTKFNDTINELKKKQERKGVHYSQEQMDALARKGKEVKTRLNALKTIQDEKEWEGSKAKLEQFAKDVDSGLREAMTHWF